MNNDNNLAIEAKGLNKIYKNKNGKNINALEDFNINIPRGKIHFLPFLKMIFLKRKCFS